jgi:CDP-glucose 4,6-dehydratase
MQTVAAVCEAICLAIGGNWTPAPGDHPAEARSLRLDSSKAMLELGWRPHWSLAETLVHVADWYREYRAGGDARTLCLRQIESYMRSAERH